MIISASFRDPYKKEFTNGPYAFECEFDVNIGDLVLVETKYGISLAQVHKLDVTVSEYVAQLYGKLSPVLEICKTQCPLPEVK